MNPRRDTYGAITNQFAGTSQPNSCELFTMFRNPLPDASLYVPKPVTLKPAAIRLMTSISILEGMLNIEWDLWTHSPGSKTRENITNVKVFLNTMRAALEAEDDGFRTLLVAIVDVGSLKKLLMRRKVQTLQ